VPWAHDKDLSRALPGHRVERSCAACAWPGSLKSTARSQGGEKLCRGRMARISQELWQVIGWREAVPLAHGQDLSRALPGHRVERSCAAGAWPGSLKSTAKHSIRASSILTKSARHLDMKIFHFKKQHLTEGIETQAMYLA
jgi:hypothetical protein